MGLDREPWGALLPLGRNLGAVLVLDWEQM